MLDVPESFLALCWSSETVPLLTSTVQRGCNVGIVWQKLSIVTSRPLERSHLTLINWLRPLLYESYFLWISKYALSLTRRDLTQPPVYTRLHFLGLIFKRASVKCDNTSDSLSLCSCSVPHKTMISPRYTRQSDQHKPFKVRCIALVKHAGAFARPKLSLQNR